MRNLAFYIFELGFTSVLKKPSGAAVEIAFSLLSSQMMHVLVVTIAR